MKNDCYCYLSVCLMAAGFLTQARGANTPVVDPTEFAAAVASLRPGDTLTLQDGTWTNADLWLNANGTADLPIIVRAQTPGQVVLTGLSRLHIIGSHVVVQGLRFENGFVPSEDVIEFRGDAGAVAKNCRLTDCAIIDYNPPSAITQTGWVSLYGVSNRVDHCYFSGKNNAGTLLAVWVNNGPDSANDHRIDHNYFGSRPPLGLNGAEIIRVGTSDVSLLPSRTVVEDNYFYRCNGEVEIIANKTGENVYRHNTFVECEGTLSLRHGNRCVVAGNCFLGNGNQRAGGVRIMGEQHWVYNNYFGGLGGSEERAALSILQGLNDTPLNGYAQVKDSVVAFNTFVRCQNSLLIGLAQIISVGGVPQVTTLPPVDCRIANNVIFSPTARLIDLRTRPQNLVWEGNLAYGAALGIPSESGITEQNPRLDPGAEGLWRPSLDSPVRSAAQGAYPQIVDDIDGQPRPANSDSGCDQVSGQLPSRRPVGRTDVGPSWLPIVAAEPAEIQWDPPADIVFGTPLGPEQLKATSPVPGTFVYTPPPGTVLNASPQQVLSVVFVRDAQPDAEPWRTNVFIHVLKATPLLVWTNPEAIDAGTALSQTQLNATSSVDGTFLYDPPAGTLLPAGEAQVLSVTFTPQDTANYESISQSVVINVRSGDGSQPQEHWAGTVEEFQAALAQAQPGDTFVLRNGVWTDADLLFKALGTADRPITLRAQDPGQVILKGRSRLRLAGNYLVVQGLHFKEGTLDAGDVIAFREKSTSVASSCRVTECAITSYNPTNSNAETRWVMLYGFSNRVDHCYFADKQNAGSVLRVWVDTALESANAHQIDHNYFGPRPDLDVAGGEIIRVGTETVATNASRTRVADNFFERCNASSEIISNRASENTYEGNTFVECGGSLSLRYGNRCVVAGNVFFGRGAGGTGGVRVTGEDHAVYNNAFVDLTGTKTRAALALMQGIEDSPSNGYFQVKRVLVAFNTFVNCRNNLYVGAAAALSDPNLTATLPPLDCRIANNIVSSAKGVLVEQPIEPINLVWEGNIFNGSLPDLLTNIAGISPLDPRLELGADGLWRPAAESPALAAAQGLYPGITVDIDGQPRPSPSDAGCDQVSSAPASHALVGRAQVGPSWARSLVSESVSLSANRSRDANRFSLGISGGSPGVLVIEVSSNLVEWAESLTVTNQAILDLGDLQTTPFSRRFYRARVKTD